jgi:SAM-dependent methyltransferase
MSEEVERVRAVYARRRERAAREKGYFGFEGPAHVARVHERLARTLRLLSRHGFHPLGETRVLDLGCGEGGMLRRFTEWGAAPARLAGIDVRQDAIEQARALSPAIDLRVGTGSELPWPDGSFDLVCQHTVFTSILDTAIRQAVAAEMRRVLTRDGAVLWYDFMYDNPRNPDVRRVGKREITSLFPGFVLDLVRITLAPPLARRIPGPLLPVCYPMLAGFPLLCTHYLGILRRGPPAEAR